MVLSIGAISALGAILVGLFTGKYFLLFIGIALVGITFIPLVQIPNPVIMIIILTIIIAVIGKKK